MKEIIDVNWEQVMVKLNLSQEEIMDADPNVFDLPEDIQEKIINKICEKELLEDEIK